MNLQRMSAAIAFSVVWGIAGAGTAEPVLSIVSGAPGGYAVQNSTHGWRFTANSPIVVTHLGLFDDNTDGFRTDHPIGIFNSGGALLTSGIVHAGTGDALIDRFRYVDTPDLQLVTGRQYVIAWYTDILAPSSSDYWFTQISDGEFSVSPVITRIPNRLSKGSTGGLTLPTTVIVNDEAIGANFLFAVPEASSLALLAIGCAVIPIRRR